MKLCIATYATGSFCEVCDVSDPNKQEYASKHGYDFERNHDEAYNTGVPFFDRHRWHLDLLNSGRWDWMYLVDADAVFTNMAIRLEDLILPEDHLIFPMDAIMVQAGGFLARNSDVVKNFLKTLLSRQIGPGQSDQIEMEMILPQFNGSVRYLPQRKMGSYNYDFYRHLGGCYARGVDRNGNDGQWQKGDFVFHCPGMTIAQKVATLKLYVDLCVNRK